MGPFDWLPHAPLELLQLDWLNGVEVAVLRLDCIDPLISGNKWRWRQPANASVFRPWACCAAILKTHPLCST